MARAKWARLLLKKELISSNIRDDLNPGLTGVLLMTNCLENRDTPPYEGCFWNAAVIFLTAV